MLSASENNASWDKMVGDSVMQLGIILGTYWKIILLQFITSNLVKPSFIKICS